MPARYALGETASADYAVRTERNVVEAEATLILGRGPLGGGTALTREVALRHRKPLLVVDLDDPADPPTVRAWLAAHRVGVLNVAGPRESGCPGIGAAAAAFLTAVLRGR